MSMKVCHLIMHMYGDIMRMDIKNAYIKLSTWTSEASQLVAASGVHVSFYPEL